MDFVLATEDKESYKPRIDTNSHEVFLDRIDTVFFRYGFTPILYLPAGADLSKALSIPVSAKLGAGVRWAIRDGRHNNMQASKKEFFISHKYPKYSKLVWLDK